MKPLSFAALLALAGAAFAEPIKLPVKEVTAFKDGHAYVIHQGSLPVTGSGDIAIDQLPTPVLGTFWPYSADKAAKLKGVVAARQRVNVERTALTIRELIEANPGAEVMLTEGPKAPYQAKLVQVLSRSAAELEATAPMPLPEAVAQKGVVLLAKTVEGTKAINIDAITEVKFIGEYRTKLTHEEPRNRLNLQLDWGEQPKAKTAEVGYAYVQKGFRWIPSYRVEMDDAGGVTLKLQATLINELIDFDNASVNLVIGVPNFTFKETTDPIALNQILAPLSPYFQEGSLSNYSMSNSMMTQQAGRMGEVRHGGPGAAAVPAAAEGEPAGLEGKATEDLFVFTLKNITLAKGQRMVVPISEQKLTYKDIYSLEIPYAPPGEFRQQTNPQVAEMLRLLGQPKVMHKVRITNGNVAPLTTAPAMILKGGKIISQAMMTYTSKGGTVDLTMTAAIDIKVKKTEEEVKRTPNATSYDGNSFFRIDIASKLELTNSGTKPIEIEVTRYILGNVDKVDDGIAKSSLNLLDDQDSVNLGRPVWWGYYSWPYWWGHINGLSKLTWTVKLEPGKSNETKYSWFYYHR